MWVIDAKRYWGRPRRTVSGGILRPFTEKLVVGRRDCTSLVAGVYRQMEVVRAVVDPLPVIGVLCFVQADWPLIGGASRVGGVHVLWPRRLAALFRRDAGTADQRIVDELRSRLVPA